MHMQGVLKVQVGQGCLKEVDRQNQNICFHVKIICQKLVQDIESGDIRLGMFEPVSAPSPNKQNVKKLFWIQNLGHPKGSALRLGDLPSFFDSFFNWGCKKFKDAKVFCRASTKHFVAFNVHAVVAHWGRQNGCGPSYQKMVVVLATFIETMLWF